MAIRTDGSEFEMTHCAGWDIQDRFCNAEQYAEYIERHGPIRCSVHNRDAWECFSGRPVERIGQDVTEGEDV